MKQLLPRLVGSSKSVINSCSFPSTYQIICFGDIQFSVGVSESILNPNQSNSHTTLLTYFFHSSLWSPQMPWASICSDVVSSTEFLLLPSRNSSTKFSKCICLHTIHSLLISLPTKLACNIVRTTRLLRLGVFFFVQFLGKEMSNFTEKFFRFLWSGFFKLFLNIKVYFLGLKGFSANNLHCWGEPVLWNDNNTSLTLFLNWVYSCTNVTKIQ